MDGPNRRHDLPEITGARPPFRGGGGIQTIIAATDASFIARFSRSESGLHMDPKNIGSLAAISGRKAFRLASRWECLIFVMIFQESWASPLHF